MELESTFTVEKRTKNTIQYRETEAPGVPISVGALYIQKTSFSGEIPDEIVVSIRGL